MWRLWSARSRKYPIVDEMNEESTGKEKAVSGAVNGVANTEDGEQ
jgi:hypothetical protein